MSKDFFQTTINTAYEQYMKLQDRIKEVGFDKKYAEKIMNATEPNDEFLARKLLELTSLFDEMGVMVQYLHKPIREEGKLYRTADGWAVGKENLSDGATIEYMNEGKWYIGKMKYDNEQKKYIIKSEDQKATYTKLDNMLTRIR